MLFSRFKFQIRIQPVTRVSPVALTLDYSTHYKPLCMLHLSHYSIWLNLAIFLLWLIFHSHRMIRIRSSHMTSELKCGDIRGNSRSPLEDGIDERGFLSLGRNSLNVRKASCRDCLQPRHMGMLYTLDLNWNKQPPLRQLDPEYIRQLELAM